MSKPLYIVAGQSNAARQEDVQAVENALKALYGDDALNDAKIIYVAEGGTSIQGMASENDWFAGNDQDDNTGELYREMLTDIDAALADGNTHIEGVFWVQGEADRADEFRNGDKFYEENLELLYDGLTSEFPGDYPFVVAQMYEEFPAHSSISGKNGMNAIHEAQALFAEGKDNVHILDTTSVMEDSGIAASDLMGDRIHFSETGYNVLAEAFVRLVDDASAGDPPASAQPVITITENDSGTATTLLDWNDRSTEITSDVNDERAFDVSIVERDANGDAESRTQIFDNGRVDYREYVDGVTSSLFHADTAGDQFDWDTLLKEYEDGVKTKETINHDADSVSERTYTVKEFVNGELQSQTTYDGWADIGSVDTVELRNGAVRTTLDLGDHSSEILSDVGGTNNFDVWATKFDENGVQESQTRVFDNGRVDHREFHEGRIDSLLTADTGDAFVFQNRLQTYENGQLASRIRDFDVENDGSKRSLIETFEDGVRVEVIEEDSWSIF